MSKRTCTRKIEFDSAHRVMKHESKCRHLHGHRYVAEVTVCSDHLDELGRVIDFSLIKSIVGGWVDDYWDHGTIANKEDEGLIDLCLQSGWKLYTIEGNPTAENMSEYLFKKATELLRPYGIGVMQVRLYETPNCWADFDLTT